MQPASLSVLTPTPLYPAHAGAKNHSLNALRQLSNYYTVDSYCLANQPQAVDWGPLPQWCRDLQAFAPTKPHHRGIDPPAVHLEFSQPMRDYLQQRWATNLPDLLQLEGTTMAQYAPFARRLGLKAIICTVHQVGFVAQWRRLQREKHWKLRARRLAGLLSLWLYEQRALSQCDLLVTLSETDQRTLNRWQPKLNVVTVPAGVDLSQWPLCRQPQAPQQVLFVGNYFHPPNVEGALWLAREVWPLVQAQMPEARLMLAGRSPTPEIQQLASATIQVPGTIDDLADVYRQSRVVAAPIFWGSGVRIKILEGLATGLPLVTTSLAAEGLALKHETHALFAETPQTFAAALVRILQTPRLAEQLGDAGRQLIAQHYDWQAIGRQLAQHYQRLL